MKIAPNVLAVLSAAAIQADRVRLTGQLDRPLYMAVNKVLEAAGGKWNRSAKAHVFGEDIETLLDNIIVTGEVGTRQDSQQFFTPDAIADQVVTLAEIEVGNSILEPSAGDGALIRAVLRKHGDEARWFVCAIEDDPKLAFKLPLDFSGVAVIAGDFLRTTPEGAGQFNRIIMNPPFARQADIKHVTHALSFLQPGGRLVSIMSAGVKFRQDKRAAKFRDLVLSRGGSITDLPEGAFKSSGTMVNTLICVVPA